MATSSFVAVLLSAVFLPLALWSAMRFTGFSHHVGRYAPGLPPCSGVVAAVNADALGVRLATDRSWRAHHRAGLRIALFDSVWEDRGPRGDRWKLRLSHDVLPAGAPRDPTYRCVRGGCTPASSRADA